MVLLFWYWLRNCRLTISNVCWQNIKTRIRVVRPKQWLWPFETKTIFLIWRTLKTALEASDTIHLSQFDCPLQNTHGVIYWETPCWVNGLIVHCMHMATDVLVLMCFVAEARWCRSAVWTECWHWVNSLHCTSSSEWHCWQLSEQSAQQVALRTTDLSLDWTH